MLSNVYYGNTLKEWMISVLIVIGAILLNKIIVLVNKHLIHRFTGKTKSRLDDILFQMLEAPVLLGVMLLAIWIASSRLELSAGVDKFFLHSYKFLIVLNITWFVVRFVNALIEEYLVPAAENKTTKYLDNTLIPIIRRGVLGAIWAIGLMMALKNMGVDVGALIAGLGIGGLAFALAAQDTIKNIFGGVTIFTDRPFRIGDRILVDGFDGFVEDIGIRSTRLRTLEKRLVTIPNYKIVEASIENITEEPMRRVLMDLGLTYDTTPEKMSEALSILKSLPNQVKNIDEKEILAFFSEYGNFSLNIKFIYWIKDNSILVETMSEVNLTILQKFNQAGLNFAFPTQTVILNKEESVQ
jgi:MscS family membrane protein